MLPQDSILKLPEQLPQVPGSTNLDLSWDVFQQLDSTARSTLDFLWSDSFHIKWGLFHLLPGQSVLVFVFFFRSVLSSETMVILYDFSLDFKQQPGDVYLYVGRLFYNEQVPGEYRTLHVSSFDYVSVDILSARKLYVRTSNPISETLLRSILITGALDHSFRSFKARLLSSPQWPSCGYPRMRMQNILSGLSTVVGSKYVSIYS